MATGGGTKPKKHSGKKQKSVKIYITTFADEFHAEREFMRNEVLPELRQWTESKNLTIKECFVKWGSFRPERRDVCEQEKIQTSIENCYFSDIMPIFLNFTSESVGWIPMWDEYPDECVEDFIEAYGLLVEDLEVMSGAFREDNKNSLFLSRDDSFLDKVAEQERNKFLKKSPVVDRIHSHGEKIVQKFPSHRIIKYKAEYGGLDQKRKARLKFDDNLKQEILDFCIQRISYDYFGEQPKLSLSDNTSARQEHLAFMRNKSDCVIGRDTMIKMIEDYILREDKDVPLLLVGEPGVGKSSILCKAACQINSMVENGQFPKHGDKSWHVFFHFVGAVPGSTCIETMLKRLLTEVEILNDSNIPRGVESTAQMCCGLLSNPNTRPIIIFVDALNQFSDEQAARVISWLPRKLAPQIRCIFSMVEDSSQHKVLINRETKPIELSVPPLKLESRKLIVTEFLQRYNKTLTDRQLDCLLQKDLSANLLWLSVACEELKSLNNQEVIEKKIQEMPAGLPNLLENLLMRFEDETGGSLVVATLCLIEASTAGLLESELRDILGNEITLMPPSPFDEKEEKESSEKESCKHNNPLSDRKWRAVFDTLKPYLRPYADCKGGRLDFYHRALSKAVRHRYFKKTEDKGGTDEKSDAFYWWHKKLADYFEHVDNIDRYVEEYLFQLVSLEDTYRLAECLCDWRIFDSLYQEEYSSKLLSYWRKVGTAGEMISHYEKALKAFEESNSANEEAISIRYEKVCRVVIQAGKYHEALELLKTAMKIEEKELGARAYRMVELYALMAEIYDEKLKLNDFVNPSQLPDLKMTIHYGRKSIGIRKTLPGPYHKFKLAMSFMKLAFDMESWEACGGGPEMSGEEALTEGNKYIDKALKIFEELNDQGHYAEALMTKGVLAPRGSMEQLKLYNQAKDLCMQMYGEYHILTSRLYINIGIVYEDNNEYKKAYEYFKKWARVSEEILGPDHPKTQRAKGVLKESRYRRIAIELGELQADNQDTFGDQDSEDEVVEMCQESQEFPSLDLEHYCEQEVGLNDNGEVQLNIRSDSNTRVIELSTEGCSGPVRQVENTLRYETQNNEDEDDEDPEAFMNGYDDRNPDEDSDEDSDEENYDDNCEDFDEQYILHGDDIDNPFIENFNVNLEDDDDDEDDDEIVQLTSREPAEEEDHLRNWYHAGDNRYEDDRDGHENSDEDLDVDESAIAGVSDSNRTANDREQI
ncbi:hypothetical protein FSP39_011663 [Pinctada imbricata]|uniref:Uncharacterized protein n=1 Tax=Pinctada imbricata TaxID=66713 RepID=A0AA89BPD1_PINIB|nr:hypothetical protein FSP39_011663 [Pinctada imbricata]